MEARIKLQKAMAEAVKKATGLVIKPEEVQLEHPENEKFGDYSANIAMTIFSKLKVKSEKLKVTIKNPLDLAQAIKNHLLTSSLSHSLTYCRVAAPGFINFFLKPSWLIGQLLKPLNLPDGKAGLKLFKPNYKIMVEYAHPNTHKQFHIGHLRNITNGEAIVRLLEALGAKVIRANYQGDVGMHIAKCLYSILQTKNYNFKFKKLKNLKEKVEFLGKAYALGNRAYETVPQAKKEILEINKKIYDRSDTKINKLWRETRQWSLDYFATIYKRVDSHFDRYYFEGEVYEKGRELVLAGLKKGIFKKSKGAIIFPGSQCGLHDRVFITSEGNPTYEAKDMELGRLQFEEYQPDLIIHNVGPEQAGYFKVVFKALEKLFPYTKGREYHLAYGWVKLKKGKMSSRSGKVVLGEWLLDEAKNKIKKAFPEINEQTAEMIAVGAVKYSFLKVSPPREVAFDFKESISLQGNSGPYLQYTFARCQSVLEKAKKTLREGPTIVGRYSKVNREEEAILRAFYKFPEVVEEAGKNYAPNLICNFLYDLAQKYNTFYNKHRILESQNPKLKTQNQNSNLKTEQTNFRLSLTFATAQIIKSGLYLLGIKTPEKM